MPLAIVGTFSSPRAWAFTLLGIHEYLRSYAANPTTVRGVAVVGVGEATNEKLLGGSVAILAEGRGTREEDLNGSSRERGGTGQTKRQGEEERFFHISCFLFC